MLIYGSFVNGSATDKSDLDLIYVPRTERGNTLGRTFILDGIGFDIWRADWERLEQFARFDDMRVSILADSRLVYYYSEHDRIRYESLRQQARDIENGLLTPELLDKTRSHLCKAKEHFADLCLGNGFANVGRILYKILDAVFLVNHTYLRFGIKKCVEELERLPELPEKLADLFLAAAEAGSVKQAIERCADLIRTTEAFVNKKESGMKESEMKEFENCHQEDAVDFTGLTGLYEEIASTWNKVRYSCGEKNSVTACLAAASLSNELMYVQQSIGKPSQSFSDFSNCAPSDFERLIKTANEAEKDFVSLLNEHQIPIRRYNLIDDLRKDLLR
jgi:predicted nucleotidyltransferase